LTVQHVSTTEHGWGTQAILCRPERRNALDGRTIAELRDVFATEGVGAILLAAEGPAFCAGGDLRTVQQSAAAGSLAELLTTNAAAFADLIEAMVACPRPIIAAIDGPAVGGGACLALACDVRLATARARLVFGWARLGLPPDGHARTLLAHAVGPDRADALLAEAAEIGPDSDLGARVFTRVVDAARLPEEAAAIASRAVKAAGRAALLEAMQAARAEELGAIARAAADEATGERLAVLYKIDR
jgi:enoyl-CoA hydratase/carnithine racemase